MQLTLSVKAESVSEFFIFQNMSFLMAVEVSLNTSVIWKNSRGKSNIIYWVRIIFHESIFVCVNNFDICVKEIQSGFLGDKL